jgi:hypothetical protein
MQFKDFYASKPDMHAFFIGTCGNLPRSLTRRKKLECLVHFSTKARVDRLDGKYRGSYTKTNIPEKIGYISDNKKSLRNKKQTFRCVNWP